MTVLDLLIMALAAWRLSALLVKEDGPFGLLARMRALPHGGLLDCIKCTSVWAALLVLVLWMVFTSRVLWWSEFIVAWLAVSGLALMLRTYTGVHHG